jgi:hypothetical protein
VLNEHWVSKEGFAYPDEEAAVLDAILDKLQELAREGSKRMRCGGLWRGGGGLDLGKVVRLDL